MSAARRYIIGCSRRRALTRSTSFPRAANCSGSPGGTPVFQNLFRKAEIDWDKRPTAEWLEAYGGQLDEVRSALDWAFSADGDARLGTALHHRRPRLSGLQLSLIDECRRRVEQALAVIQAQGSRDPRRDMQLSAALGSRSSIPAWDPKREPHGRTRSRLPRASTISTTSCGRSGDCGSIVLQQRRLPGSADSGKAVLFDGRKLGRSHRPVMGDRMIGIRAPFHGRTGGCATHIERMLAAM